jgi:hypothetical protein
VDTRSVKRRHRQGIENRCDFKAPGLAYRPCCTCLRASQAHANTCSERNNVRGCCIVTFRNAWLAACAGMTSQQRTCTLQMQ